LLKFCAERGLFLDRHGARAGVRTGKKVSWQDKYGNLHDLDFVIEKDGAASKQGRPVAFNEAAWRRYTKHSKSKAQEIQGAILPIAEKYEKDSPFLGAVLAGEFTRPALEQLQPLNFQVVYVPYQAVVKAFAEVNIDAAFDEATSDKAFSACIRKIETLSQKERAKLKAALLKAGQSQFDKFFDKLRLKLDRIVERVIILPLFGEDVRFESIGAAASFLDDYSEKAPAVPFRKYEIAVVYSNGDEMRGSFSSREGAKSFLDYVASAR